MITNFYTKKDLFRNSNVDTVFISCFGLLYQYSRLFFKNFKDWPGVQKTIKAKTFGHNTCRRFRSKKYLGTLFVLSHKISGLENNKDVDKYISNLKYWLEKISSTFDAEYRIYRVDLSSFPKTYNEVILFKLLKVFADSKQHFEIYR